jgi:UDP:flavonoid glycosyltransferase YjiC (YdhE family)
MAITERVPLGYRSVMHVLFTTQPAYGHLHPIVPLGRALQAAGHEVRVASSASFGPQLGATGLRFTEAGIDWLESDIASGFPEYAVRRAAGESKTYLISEIFAWQTARAMATDVTAMAGDWQVDLIVREPWEFGGAIAAHRLTVPCVVHGIGQLANLEETVEIARDRLRELSAESGLDAESLSWVCGEIYLDPCPPCLRTPVRSVAPRHVLPVRPQPFDTTDGAPDPPAWFECLGDRPVIYVGLGTVMNRWGDLLERIVSDLHSLDADIVVTTGPGRDPADLGPQPSHVHVEQYMPATKLFPRCDLVVSHAGWGTTIAALAHGLPVVAIPIGADGPRNAAQCEAAGLGRMILANDLAPGLVADAAQQVLSDPRYRQAAAEARDEIQRMPAPTDIVEALETITL